MSESPGGALVQSAPWPLSSTTSLLPPSLLLTLRIRTPGVSAAAVAVAAPANDDDAAPSPPEVCD